MRHSIKRVTLAIFAVYVMLVPGSSWVVALDLVPQWGLGFGSVLLLLQGAAMASWLAWRYGSRGVLAGMIVAVLGFGVEYVGETTGFPFGRYQYTELVQPQLFGVPLAICAAWMMVAVSSFEIASRIAPRRWGRNSVLLLTATLVLLLDLQIETVAALVNNYWQWIDSGPYYGVPTANFVAWWLVGFAMAMVLSAMLGGRVQKLPEDLRAAMPFVPLRLTAVPAALYLLSTVMFTVINLARGYLLAGLVGVAVLLGALAISGYLGGFALWPTARRRYD